MIEQIVDRLKEALLYVENIVIVSSFDSYSIIRDVFKHDPSIFIFKGDEENVLKRFYFANKEHNKEHIIRATADNPFLSVYHLSLSLKAHIKKNADLTRYINLPLGSGVEIIKKEALEKAYSGATTPYEKEHVTPFIYSNKDKFKVLDIEPECIYKRPNIRLTVDHKEDFSLARTIFNKLYKGSNTFTLKEIIDLWDKDNLCSINGHILQNSH